MANFSHYKDVWYVSNIIYIGKKEMRNIPVCYQLLSLGMEAEVIIFLFYIFVHFLFLETVSIMRCYLIDVKNIYKQ